ncbi:SDR family oxidoreductase [Roseibium denhamense]|uniref:NADP-dependent 3-hydroxy acid dehydrogenase YdfG n=1 Tax=Roseibium denhamense TaxID=76305 RepID=A0ABY1PKP7_9HYPH|nr:SDR family oxidoreductase [Roseibium denhamense]MTI05875.1 SDR family oxidoreductase [Roseibium denhamense]SMP35548.1 NADP-dependent 3-hydroxy acid dehydrogenase YdfG [Roseibium denhamense]
MFDLSGKVALVTGASRGIGEAAARAFARSGAKTVLAARSSEDIERIAQEINSSGGEALAVACDVSDYGSMQAAVTKAIEAFGGLDILVNNAGIIEPISRIEDSDPDAWGKVIDINVKGVYNGIRAVVPHMLKSGSGTIVNISSGAATGALEGWSHYCSSKAAALSLTRCADKEFGDKGLRIVGLSPGTVATQMQVDIKASGINPVSQLDPAVHIPADWVGQAICWLCTPAGDAYRGTDCSLRDEDVRKAVGLV